MKKKALIFSSDIKVINPKYYILFEEVEFRIEVDEQFFYRLQVGCEVRVTDIMEELIEYNVLPNWIKNKDEVVLFLGKKGDYGLLAKYFWPKHNYAPIISSFRLGYNYIGAIVRSNIDYS